MNQIEYRILKTDEIRDIRTNISGFLHEHLDEFGDKEEDILKAIDYIFTPGKGGTLAIATHGKEIVGAIVVNNTGMQGYIPENILVYIAVNKNHRGKGIGKTLMEKIISTSSGAIALHVEPNNPAKMLYEKLGFTNKYLEMRLAK